MIVEYKGKKYVTFKSVSSKPRVCTGITDFFVNEKGSWYFLDFKGNWRCFANNRKIDAKIIKE